MDSNHSVYFHGNFIDTTFTSKSSAANDWVRKILSPCRQKIKTVGLNCKWERHPIKSMSGKISTLQLCFDTNCLILQLFCMDVIPQSLRDFLSDPNIVFVGVEMEEVSVKLKEEYGLCCNKKIDVRSLVKINYPLSFSGKPSLKLIANQLLQLSSWEMKTLNLRNKGSRLLKMEQINRACIDAYVSYRIGSNLLAGI
ncbi:hypothetical protein ACFE04_018020 [Oxalis oulophora]